MINRRTVLACAAIVGTFFTPALAQENSGELILYYGMGRSGVQPVIDAFQEKTGITVNSLRQPTEELMSTIELEMRADQAKADVIFISEAQLKALNDSHDALRPYTPAGFEHVPDSLKDPDGKRIPALVVMYVIQYNKDAIPPEEAPKSFADLLDEKWTNKLVIADPQSSSSVHSFVWLTTEALKSKGAPFGWDYFKKLGTLNVLLAGGHGNIRDMVVSAERPIGVQVVGTANQSVLAGEPTAWNWPSEGTTAEILSLGVLKDSPNAANAEKFVDFLLSPEGQTILAENTGHAPVRTDAEFKYADGVNVGNLPVELHPVDVGYVADNRVETMRNFQDAMRQ